MPGRCPTTELYNPSNRAIILLSQHRGGPRYPLGQTGSLLFRFVVDPVLRIRKHTSPKIPEFAFGFGKLHRKHKASIGKMFCVMNSFHKYKNPKG